MADSLFLCRRLRAFICLSDLSQSYGYQSEFVRFRFLTCSGMEETKRIKLSAEIVDELVENEEFLEVELA